MCCAVLQVLQAGGGLGSTKRMVSKPPSPCLVTFAEAEVALAMTRALVGAEHVGGDFTVVPRQAVNHTVVTPEGEVRGVVKSFGVAGFKMCRAMPQPGFRFPVQR